MPPSLAGSSNSGWRTKERSVASTYRADMTPATAMLHQSNPYLLLRLLHAWMDEKTFTNSCFPIGCILLNPGVPLALTSGDRENMKMCPRINPLIF